MLSWSTREVRGVTKVYTNNYNRKRPKQLKVYYTQEEFNLIKTAAKLAGQPMNAYILRAVIALQEQEQQAQDNQQATK